jgi:hypothetical protein
MPWTHRFRAGVPYRSAELATLGRATTFNRLFLAGLHPELHRQAIVGVTREAKANSITFADLVQELRTFLINKTIGNDFGHYCSKHRQPEGHDVATYMATLQPTLPYFDKELETNMGRKALLYTFKASVQQELVD